MRSVMITVTCGMNQRKNNTVFILLMFTGFCEAIVAEGMSFILYLQGCQCFLEPEILFGLIFGASGLTWGPIG